MMGAETDEQQAPRKCFVCGRRELDATELQTCVGCINSTRRQLLEIVDLYPEMSPQMAERAGAAAPLDPTGTRSSDIPMPGGDALVMLAGGSGRRHYDDRTDVDSIVGALALWEDDWRTHFGVKAATRTATLGNVTTYLLDNLARAAQWHPAFDEFAREVRQHHYAVLRVTGNGDVLEKGAPCPYCGSRIIRRYANAGPCPDVWVAAVDTLGYGVEFDYGIIRAHFERCRHDAAEGHDQGGRRDEWICSNRECNQPFDEREHRFAVWQAHNDRAEAS